MIENINEFCSKYRSLCKIGLRIKKDPLRMAIILDQSVTNKDGEICYIDNSDKCRCSQHLTITNFKRIVQK